MSETTTHLWRNPTTFEEIHAAEYACALEMSQTFTRKGDPLAADRWLRLAEHHLVVAERLEKARRAQCLREAPALMRRLEDEEAFADTVMSELNSLKREMRDPNWQRELREWKAELPFHEAIANWRGKPLKR